MLHIPCCQPLGWPLCSELERGSAQTANGATLALVPLPGPPWSPLCTFCEGSGGKRSCPAHPWKLLRAASKGRALGKVLKPVQYQAKDIRRMAQIAVSAVGLGWER